MFLNFEVSSKWIYYVFVIVLLACNFVIPFVEVIFIVLILNSIVPLIFAIVIFFHLINLIDLPVSFVQFELTLFFKSVVIVIVTSTSVFVAINVLMPTPVVLSAFVNGQ